MQNILFDNSVIEPSWELAPIIRISPFSNADLLCATPSEDEKKECESYLKERFGTYYILPKGRSAIAAALLQYDLQADDVVTILTTSGNFYISGCVTREIEKVCQWNRELTDKTKLIFVNHEFGYPYQGVSELRKYGLPIIEDCAHAFYTQDDEMGTVGDYVIYSLPKALPMQIGAILVANTTVNKDIHVDATIASYVIERLCSNKGSIIRNRNQRLQNYTKLCDLLRPLGIEPYFKLIDGVVPGVLLFRWHETIDYPRLKAFMQENGVESSVFYGQNAFYIPCHQNLTEAEMTYMRNLLKYFDEKNANK